MSLVSSIYGNSNVFFKVGERKGKTKAEINKETQKRLKTKKSKSVKKKPKRYVKL